MFVSPVNDSALMKIIDRTNNLSDELSDFQLPKLSSITDVFHKIASCCKLGYQIIPVLNQEVIIK